MTNHSIAYYFAFVQDTSTSCHLSSCTGVSCFISQLSPGMLYVPDTTVNCLEHLMFRFRHLCWPSEKTLTSCRCQEILCSQVHLVQVGVKLSRRPPALLPLHNFLVVSDGSFWCCCLHSAFQRYWSPLNFKAKDTNTWLCKSPTTHTTKIWNLLLVSASYLEKTKTQKSISSVRCLIQKHFCTISGSTCHRNTGNSPGIYVFQDNR